MGLERDVDDQRLSAHLDGYPECGFTAGHDGGHDYVRHAAEGFLAPAVVAEEPESEPELEAGS